MKDLPEKTEDVGWSTANVCPCRGDDSTLVEPWILIGTSSIKDNIGTLNSICEHGQFHLCI